MTEGSMIEGQTSDGPTAPAPMTGGQTSAGKGILDKFAPLKANYDQVRSVGADPFTVRVDDVTSPTTATLNGKPTLLLGTHNYLGLTYDESCIEASVAAVRAEGTGTTGSRIANGSYGDHRALEAELCDFFDRRHAMVFSTGYQANLGMLATLVGRGDHLLLDADSHASIYDASRMGAAEVIRFRHNDVRDLDKRLRRLADTPGDVMIVVEGIYSMLGDVAPLQEIVAVKRQTGATLLVDEAHSVGVLGEKGRGLAEAAGVEADVDVIVGTFSKSLGSVGGFVVSDLDGFDVMRVACRPYMFTASLPPAVAASTLQALKVMRAKPELRERLHANAGRLYRGLEGLGYQLGPTLNPIVAVAMPDKETAVGFWNALLEGGVYMNLALPPATPTQTPLLRASLSAAHTPEQIDQVIALFARLGEAFGLLPTQLKRAAG